MSRCFHPGGPFSTGLGFASPVLGSGRAKVATTGPNVCIAIFVLLPSFEGGEKRKQEPFGPLPAWSVLTQTHQTFPHTRKVTPTARATKLPSTPWVLSYIPAVSASHACGSGRARAVHGATDAYTATFAHLERSVAGGSFAGLLVSV
mmetsp:Transcript_31054/g.58227  ORF Transcript_31054/g.58227 Transcript_31054/m.58227 type:complete len:147 (+) Transcript_31054:218-658(+)